MTRKPFGPQDRAWLLSRLIVLGIVLFFHPLPLDPRRWDRWDIVVPAHSAQIAYVVFECLQFVVFAAALFYGDLLPGMRWVTAYYRRLTAEIREASWRVKLLKPMPFILCCGVAIWFILSPLEAVVYAVPPGAPRFCAATTLFIFDRFAVIFIYILIVNANDDENEPGERRRSIAASLATILSLGRPRVVARAPVTTS